MRTGIYNTTPYRGYILDVPAGSVDYTNRARHLLTAMPGAVSFDRIPDEFLWAK